MTKHDILEYFKDINHYYNNSLNSMLNELIETEQSNLGWISVKDRLPEVGGWYLCFKEAAFVPGLRTDVHRWSATKEEWMGSEVGSRIVGVTHWMPLPEPPKEE